MSKTGFLLVSVPPSDSNQSVDTTYRTIESLLGGSSHLADTSKFTVPEFKVGTVSIHDASVSYK